MLLYPHVLYIYVHTHNDVAKLVILYMVIIVVCSVLYIRCVLVVCDSVRYPLL